MKYIVALLIGFLLLGDAMAQNPPGPRGGPGGRGPGAPGPGRPGVAPARRVNPRAVRGALVAPVRRVTPRPGVRAPVPVRRRVLPPRVIVPPRVPLVIRPVARVYYPERNVVVVEGDNGESQEMPYVSVPVLFVKGTDVFLDQESYRALEDMAKVINDIRKDAPDATFDIEGHTCTEGSEESNLDLSARRAKRVYDELTSRYGVSPEILSAQGYGESYAQYPGGTEEERQLDRRVLLVRTK